MTGMTKGLFGIEIFGSGIFLGWKICIFLCGLILGYSKQSEEPTLLNKITVE